MSSRILETTLYSIAGKSDHAVDRLAQGRPPLAFEDLFAFHTRKGEARAFSLGNAEGREVVTRESWCRRRARVQCVCGVCRLVDISRRLRFMASAA